MPGVEALGDPLEEDVVEEAVAPEADERLGEVEVALLPALPEPGVPAALQRGPHHLGADRDPKRCVLREVAGRVEGDEEAADGVDAEEDGREDPEGVATVTGVVGRRGRPERHDGAVAVRAVGPKPEQPPDEAGALEKRVLEREPEEAAPRALHVHQLAAQAAERVADEGEERC